MLLPVLLNQKITKLSRFSLLTEALARSQLRSAFHKTKSKKPDGYIFFILATSNALGQTETPVDWYQKLLAGKDH